MTTFKIFIPVKPVPAARPKVTRWGTYFPKTYTDFRNEVYGYLKTIKSQYPKKENVAFKVKIDFICRRPKNPSNEYPVGDVDNYLKGPLDAFTKCEMFWEDDVQVIDLHGTKRYAKKNEQFGMHITITEYSPEESSELLRG